MVTCILVVLLIGYVLILKVNPSMIKDKAKYKKSLNVFYILATCTIISFIVEVLFKWTDILN